MRTVTKMLKSPAEVVLTLSVYQWMQVVTPRSQTVLSPLVVDILLQV